MKRRFPEMIEDENRELKNKLVDLRERLNQIYSQSALDAHKSKAFESELSLYTKASEHAHHERMEAIGLQYNVTKFGLAMLTVLMAVTAYGFFLHIILGLLILLAAGVISCGFMYLLLAGEIRARRAGEFCRELEVYFKQYRWAAENAEALHLPDIPLWEEYRSSWNKDLFAAGPYGRTAVYAPFRMVITLMDISALGYLVYSFAAHGTAFSWIVIVASSFAWVMAVTLHMLLVNTVINTLPVRLSGERTTEYQKKRFSWHPATWFTLIELFLALDIIFPQAVKKTARKKSD